ncbi:sensor histidine kinase [Bacteroidota bacterium]
MESIEKRNLINKFSSILLHPAFLAAVVTIIILFILDPINKHTIDVVSRYTVDKEKGCETYFDLDHDGNSEKIISYENNVGDHAVKIMDLDDNIFNQWNLKGKLPLRDGRMSFGDYNNDKLSEIYAFTQLGDSILLHILEHESKNDPKGIFIDTISNYNNVIDYTINPGFLIDINNDGFKDLVFNINAGFSLQPRNLYIYDIHNKKLIKSKENGVNNNTLKFCDLNDDGFLEILVNTSSTANIKEPLDIKYHDSSSWLMVYDRNLSFLFPPIEFPGFKSYVETLPVTINGEKYILAYYRYQGIKDYKNKLMLFTKEGIKVKEEIDDKSSLHIRNLLEYDTNNFKLTITDFEGNEIIIDSNILFSVKSRLSEKSIYLNGNFELDGNQGMERLFSEESYSMFYIYNNKRDRHTSFDLDLELFRGPFSTSVIERKDNKPLLFIQKGISCNIIDYSINSWYKFRFLIYLLMYFTVLLFIFIIRQSYKIQLQKRVKLENEITELQLNLENNQLNPHFIFNAINSITAAIYKNKKEEAYDLGVKLTNLMRETVISSKKIKRSLESELEFTRNYIELQKQRFNNIFDYTIDIAPDTDTSIEVPRMIIHNFAENAIKHGLIPKKENGKLDIKVFCTNEIIKVIIQDNGIGRKNSESGETRGTGTGINTMNKILQLLKKINKQNISFAVIDIYNDKNMPAGTRVEISIPL